mgnify:FL=1|jgi:hypothetical protein
MEMTIPQLNVAVHRELSYMANDETMMERVLKSLRKIRRERKTELATHAAENEIKANLQEAFSEFKRVQDGKAETRDFFEVINEL